MNNNDCFLFRDDLKALKLIKSVTISSAINYPASFFILEPFLYLTMSLKTNVPY